MKHTVRIFEVDKAGQKDRPPTEHESIQVEAPTLSLAREQTRHTLVKADWQVRAISHAVDGGLVAYVVKPDEQPRKRRTRTRRKSERVRKQ